MLWLSGLMGLLAVCAFTLLWFLPIRRTADDEAIDEVSAAALAEEASEAAVTQEADAAEGVTEEDARETDPDMAADDLAEDLHTDDAPARTEAPWTEADDLTAAAEDMPESDAAPEVATDAAPDFDADPDNDMDEWFLAGAGTTDFEDFDPQEDDLVVVWDDAGGPEPSVRIVRNEEDPALARVLLDDVILAQFRTRADIAYDHVSLVPLSTARSLGWARP